MRDYREKLLRELELVYQATKDIDDVSIVSDKIVKVLSNYEVSNRCTDLVPIDTENIKLIKKYSACLTIGGKSKKTIYQYTRACRKLDEFLMKPFSEIGTYDIRYFLATEKERGISNVSLENLRAYISAFFQWLTDEEIIGKNPALKIGTIKCKEEIKQPFSDVEIDALRCACITKKERAIVEILLSSGVRVSELSAMKVKDIDFQNMTVHVTQGKGDRERTTYTTPVAVTHIRNYIDSRPEKDSEYLFCNLKHANLNPGGIRYILAKLGERAGVENTHPHRFRRTFATNLSKRGMDIRDIQYLLGHKKIETTLTYVCLDTQKVHSEYRKFCN